MLFLSYVSYAFVRVCLLMPCGQLMGKRLTSWLSSVMPNCEFVTFPLESWVGQVWYVIVSISDLCPLSYFG